MLQLWCIVAFLTFQTNLINACTYLQLFFSPNFDIKWKSKHSFFVCFQQRLLKLKYYDELKKSKVLSILIFHIASFFKEKNNACRRESCFFTETIFLSQRVLFWDGETWFFFEEEVGIVLFNLNNVVSVEKASLRTFEDFHHFFWKDSNLNFCQKLLRCSGWWYLLFQSEYENFWN